MRCVFNTTERAWKAFMAGVPRLFLDATPTPDLHTCPMFNNTVSPFGYIGVIPICQPQTKNIVIYFLETKKFNNKKKSTPPDFPVTPSSNQAILHRVMTHISGTPVLLETYPGEGSRITLRWTSYLGFEANLWVLLPGWTRRSWRRCSRNWRLSSLRRRSRRRGPKGWVGSGPSPRKKRPGSRLWFPSQGLRDYSTNSSDSEPTTWRFLYMFRFLYFLTIVPLITKKICG